jgi:glutaredoxin
MKHEDQKFIYILMHNMDANLQEIMVRYNWRTVPLVIEKEETGEEKFIGGCDDTIELIKRRRDRADPISTS